MSQNILGSAASVRLKRALAKKPSVSPKFKSLLHLERFFRILGILYVLTNPRHNKCFYFLGLGTRSPISSQIRSGHMRKITRKRNIVMMCEGIENEASGTPLEARRTRGSTAGLGGTGLWTSGVCVGVRFMCLPSGRARGFKMR